MSKKEQAKDRYLINVWVDPATHRALTTMAALNERKIVQEVRLAIRNHLNGGAS